MALRAVPEHPKFVHLKTILGAPRAHCLGYLECIWHFCGRFTPQGNIGKYSDVQIEAWAEWTGPPGGLIAALIEARWIDRDLNHRLVVHDWHIHADATTKLSLKRSKKEFVATVSIQCRDTVQADPFVKTKVIGPSVPEPVPEPEPVPDAGSSRDSVATQQQQPPPTKKKPEPPQPTPSAFDPSGNRDRSEMAHQLVAELAPKHPVPANVHYAKAEVERILAKAVDPEAVCKSARKNHAAAVEYWNEANPKFIPNLSRWFHDGDYMYAPSRIAGPGAKSAMRKLESMLSEELERKKNGSK